MIRVNESHGPAANPQPHGAAADVAGTPCLPEYASHRDDSGAARGRRRPTPLAWFLLLPVRFYRRLIGPLLPPSCRFYPSCSAYAVESLTRHGAVRGLVMTLFRLLRCGPWHPGGLDPVPGRFSVRAQRPGTSTEE